MSWFKKLFGQPTPQDQTESSVPTAQQPTPATPPAPLNPSSDLKATAKSAWIWKMEDGEGAETATRTGGRPVMAPEEVWPECKSCSKPLTLMTQCNLDTLPAEMGNRGGGILRVFYCMQEDCVGMGGWDAFDPQHHLSVLKGGGVLRDAPDGTQTFAAEFVSDLDGVEDYPHWEDRGDLNIETLPQDDDIRPAQGHKYAGWPYWIQGAERPQCPKCDATMQVFLQLDNDCNREFNFGGGTGHVSQCETHKDVFAFGWACG